MKLVNGFVRAAALAGVVSAAASTSASAQVDSRWRAWTGCWAPQGQSQAISREALVCVLPTEKASAVEIASVVGGKLADRSRVDADGQPHTVERDGCTGSSTARWSQTGTRVHISESFSCSGGPTRTGTGVMSFTQQYEWLDVRGMSSGGMAGVAVARYQPVLDTTGLPDEAKAVVSARGVASNTAMLAASAPLSLADIADVATSTDSGVAATWLAERTRGVRLTIEGKQLVALADQGVPGSVIDVVVALAHPQTFALNAGTPAMMQQPKTGGRTAADYSYWRRFPSYYGFYGYSSWDPFYDFYSPYGYGIYRSTLGGYYGGYYGGWYGGAYYPGYTPIVVVTRGGDDTGITSQHGRVVKGRGYSSGEGSSGGSATRSTTSSDKGGASGSSSSGSSGSTSSAGGSSSGGSSSGGGDRTAVRRPPQ